MWNQAKLLKFLGVCLSLLLLVMPLQSAQGQDEPTEADGQETAGEVVDEGSQVDTSNQTNRMYLPLIQGPDDGPGTADEEVEVEPAFNEPWNPPAPPNDPTCVNVLAAERIFLDDLPGGNLPIPETGLFAFVENSALDETCTSISNIPAPYVSTNVFSRLVVRYALNDQAAFSVRLWRRSIFGCNIVFTTLTATDDTSLWTTRVAALPAGALICRVDLILTDDPNSTAGIRTSVLIDYVQFRTPGGVINGLWREDFSGPGPF